MRWLKTLSTFTDFNLARIRLHLAHSAPMNSILLRLAKLRHLSGRPMKLVLSFFTLISLLSCKSLPSKEMGKRVCTDPDSKKILYTAEAFSLALNVAVRNAAKVDGNRDLLSDFFPNTQIDSFLKGEFADLFQTELENCGLSEIIARAGKTEVAELNVMRGPNSKILGGSVIFQGHIFPQFTFEARTAAYGIPEEFKRKEWQSAEAVLKGTAWFEWRKGSFQFHSTGANRKILELLEGNSKDLVLFRGAGAESTHGDTITSFRNESTMFGKDPFLVLQGIFFTTSEADAKKWANPFLSSLSTSPMTLLELDAHDKPSIYVNYNRKNLDIAIFINSKNQKTLDLLSTLTVKCTVIDNQEEKQLNPDGELAAEEATPLINKDGIGLCP